jgi:dihydroorotase/N-acyl-D-amino-acid deacylase
MPQSRLLALLLLFLAAPLTASAQSTAPYDEINRHGHVIDGTGSPWYAADVGVRDGHIAAIGDLAHATAKQSIDAHGMVVAPGFIDMLGQSELTILVDPRLPSKIFQGITTEITGEGESVAPLDSAMLAEDAPTYQHYGIDANWRTLAQYFARLESQGIGINIGTYVGAASVREMVLGYGDRTPTPDELHEMQDLVAQAMQEGALGVSTALQYPPAPYAKTDELIALATTASQYGGIYATHMRSEGETEMAALDETFRIARDGQVPEHKNQLHTRGE